MSTFSVEAYHHCTGSHRVLSLLNCRKLQCLAGVSTPINSEADPCVQAFNAQNLPLDFLILNAGIMATDGVRRTTPDGLEEHFQVSRVMVQHAALRMRPQTEERGSSGTRDVRQASCQPHCACSFGIDKRSPLLAGELSVSLAHGPPLGGRTEA